MLPIPRSKIASRGSTCIVVDWPLQTIGYLKDADNIKDPD